MPCQPFGLPPRRAHVRCRPNLIERFIRVRAWYLDYSKRSDEDSNKVKGWFEAATGVAYDEWCDFDRECCSTGDHDNPRRKELRAVENRIYADYPLLGDDDPEGEQLLNERWSIAEDLTNCEAQTVADFAWQAEAWMLADLEIYSFRGEASSDRMIRLLFHHLRTVGGVPQPDDPQGLLNIDISEDDEDDVEA